jgi:hypothetical protein
MIIDSPSVTEIGLGTDRRIPQPGDNQVVIPPMILPTIRPLQPVQFSATSDLPNRVSFITDFLFNDNNAAQQDDDIVTLAPGYWLLDVQLSCTVSFAGTPTGTRPVQVTISFGGYTAELLTVGSFNVQTTANRRLEMLIRQESILGCFRESTGAGDFIRGVVNVYGGLRL